VHYLAITGKKRWYLACLIGNNEFKVFTIERDEDEIRELMNAEREFYDTHIKGDLPPAIDGTDSSSEAVKTVHMVEEENEVDISDIEDEIDHIFDLKKQIKLLEGMKIESENKIKSYLGKNTFGSCPSACVSWRAQERLVFDCKAFERAYPNIDTTQFYVIQNSRILRIKRIGE
jgi:predicted phage-related endonuclease